MAGFILRFMMAALGLAIAAAVVPGMQFQGSGAVFLAALVLGFVNAVIRPILLFLTLPITIVTLGIFLLVINALLLGLVAAVVPGLQLSGFLPALLGSLVVSVVSGIASWTIGAKGRVDVWKDQSK